MESDCDYLSRQTASPSTLVVSHLFLHSSSPGRMVRTSSKFSAVSGSKGFDILAVETGCPFVQYVICNS